MFSKLHLFIYVFSLNLGILAQSNNAPCYFVTASDTTFCLRLDYELQTNHKLSNVYYTDMKGQKHVINGKNNVPDVLTFKIGKKIYDKIPINPNLPYGSTFYRAREVDGKLKVYLMEQGYGNFNGQIAPVGPYIFFLKMPDGKYYRINRKKNRKKYIIPYLLQCEEFKNAYKGDFSAEQKPFIQMIELYNLLCGNKD